MFQLDEKFLEEVGLGNLPADQKESFLEYFREQLEMRVGTMLSEGLTEEQLEEFESFMNRDEEVVDRWLGTYIPGYQDDPVYQTLKSGAPEGMPPVVVKSEFASLRWLSINRPDYKDVVKKVSDQLREETIKNRDAILGL